VCDPIDQRHQGILPPRLWGDGDPEGVRQRCADEVKNTARAAAAFGVNIVNGFTGSAVWHLIYSFPPNDFEVVEAGYQDFADRWNPIMDVFDEVGVKWGLEVHPTEIAYDFVTTEKALDAIGRRSAFGINFDPSHFAHQFLDSVAYIEQFADRIYHVHVKDSKKRLDGRRSILGSHLNFGDAARGWDFVSPGHGDVEFEEMFRALNRIGYDGPLSIEWEDSGMDRDIAGWIVTGADPMPWPLCAAPISRPLKLPLTPRLLRMTDLVLVAKRRRGHPHAPPPAHRMHRLRSSGPGTNPGELDRSRLRTGVITNLTVRYRE
jgi:sugar phosphate isomerase/epimerase